MDHTRKPETERRSRTIFVRATAAEAPATDGRADAARLVTGGYIRHLALGEPGPGGGHSPSRVSR